MSHFRTLHGRDIGVMLAIEAAVGMPWLLLQTWLFRSLKYSFPLLISRFAMSPDALTAGTMIAFCAVLGLGMFVAEQLLRRFLSH